MIRFPLSGCQAFRKSVFTGSMHAADGWAVQPWSWSSAAARRFATSGRGHPQHHGRFHRGRPFQARGVPPSTGGDAHAHDCRCDARAGYRMKPTPNQLADGIRAFAYLNRIGPTREPRLAPGWGLTRGPTGYTSSQVSRLIPAFLREKRMISSILGPSSDGSLLAWVKGPCCQLSATQYP